MSWLTLLKGSPINSRLQGAIDDFRVYRRVLPASEIRTLACESAYSSICDGLVANWQFDGDLKDTSLSRWHGTAIGATDATLFVPSFAGGGVALRLDGMDDYVALPARILGGPMTACVHARFDGFTCEDPRWLCCEF